MCHSSLDFYNLTVSVSLVVLPLTFNTNFTLGILQIAFQVFFALQLC